MLKVISGSPGELDPVFQAMLASATQLCQAQFGTLFRYDGEKMHRLAGVGTPKSLVEFQRQRGPFVPAPGTKMAEALRTQQPFMSMDEAAAPELGVAAKYGGARSTLYVPLLQDDQVEGMMVIYRQEVRPFSDRQIELVQNFAAQAVIAIENARLLNETKEALEQQTATAEVLQVINSSPGDLAPVFDAILEKAHTLCGATIGALEIWDGDHIRAFATRGLPGPFDELIRQGYRPGPDDPHWQLVDGARFVHVPDQASVVEPTHQKAVELAGIRTFLAVALRKENLLLGRIVAARKEVRPFSDKEIALLQNFAAQAVIADRERAAAQ